MGLLDDIRNQADSQRETEEAEAKRKADREAYYQEFILPRMVKAYQYFNELVNNLNYINHELYVEYPLLPNGGPVRLQQKDYKVVIDSSKQVKEINISMSGVLETPVDFELYGREVVFSHAERIGRYAFRHTRKDRKNQNMELESAKFILEGPLPLGIQIQADIDESKIRLSVRNFVEPAYTKYEMTAEQFNDLFLDRLGKFILRQEKNLLEREEISEDLRKKLQERLEIEKQLREQEMREAEERARAEAEAERQKSAKEQIKRVVNDQLSKNKDKLKGMFSKLKNQAGFDKKE